MVTPEPLHETVFAAYIKLGYYSKNSPLVELRSFFEQYYRIDCFGH